MREARRDELDDVVAFSTKAIVNFRALLFVPRLVLTSGSLFMRCFDAKGVLARTIRIDGGGGRSHMVISRDELPKAWLDPRGRGAVGLKRY